MKLFKKIYLDSGTAIGDYVVERYICQHDNTFYYSAINTNTQKNTILCEIYPQKENIGVNLHRCYDETSLILSGKFDKQTCETARKKYDEVFDKKFDFISKICKKSEEDYAEKIANKLKYFEVEMAREEISEQIPLNRYIAIEQCEDLVFTKCDEHDAIWSTVTEKNYYGEGSLYTFEKSSCDEDDNMGYNDEIEKCETIEDEVFDDVEFSHLISIIYCNFFSYEAMLKHLIKVEKQINISLEKSKFFDDYFLYAIPVIYSHLKRHKNSIQHSIERFETNLIIKSKIMSSSNQAGEKSFYNIDNYKFTKKVIRFFNALLLIACIPTLIFSYSGYMGLARGDEFSINTYAIFGISFAILVLCYLWYKVCSISYGGAKYYIDLTDIFDVVRFNIFGIKNWHQRVLVRLSSIMPMVYFSSIIMLIDMQNGMWSWDMNYLRMLAHMISIALFLYSSNGFLSDILGIASLKENAKTTSEYLDKKDITKKFKKSLKLNDKLIYFLYCAYKLCVTAVFVVAIIHIILLIINGVIL